MQLIQTTTIPYQMSETSIQDTYVQDMKNTLYPIALIEMTSINTLNLGLDQLCLQLTGNQNPLPQRKQNIENTHKTF